MLANILWTLGGLAVGYGILSAYYFQPDEVGALYFLGRPVGRIVGPGLVWYPLFFYQLKRVTTDIIRVTIPTTKEKTVKDDSVVLKDGEMRPLHVNHQEARNAHFWVHKDRGDPKSEWQYKAFKDLLDGEKIGIEDDAMNGAITSEVTAHIDFSVGKKRLDAQGKPTKEWDPESFYDYFQRVRTTKAAASRIYGTARSNLVELLSPLTARNATDAKSKIESLIKERLEISIGEKADPATGEFTEQPLGLNIRVVEIEELELGKHINQGRARGAAAVELLKETKKNAEGEAFAIEQRGKADGAADQARGEGRAKAVEAVAKAMASKDAKFAAILETTEKVSGKAKFIIAPEMGGLAATIATVAKGTSDVIGKNLED